MSDSSPTSKPPSRARRFLVSIGNKPELVALATLVTLVAFLWPICRAALGHDEPPAMQLTEVERAQLVESAIAQLKLEAREAGAREAGLTTSLDSEESLEEEAAVIETIASADTADQTYRVDTNFVIEALKDFGSGNRQKSVELLHEIARQQEEAGARVKAAGTYAQIARLHRRRDTAAQLSALQRVAELNPDHAFNWYYIATAARTLGKAELCESATRRGMEVARDTGDLQLAFMFPAQLAEIHRDAGEFDRAVEMWWTAAELARATAADAPDDRSVVWNAAFVISNAAQSTLRWGTDQAGPALAAANESVLLWEDLRRLVPEEFNEIEYADVLLSLAHVQRMTGDLEAAEGSIRRAIDVHRPAAAAAPDDPHLVGHLASDLFEASRIFLARGRLVEGQEAQADAIAHARFLLALNPDDPGQARFVAMLVDLGGQLASASGNHDAAIGHLASAREALAEVHGGAPWNSAWSDDFLACQIHLFEAHLAHGDGGEARRTGAEAEAFASQLEEAGVLGPRRVADVTRLRAELSTLNSGD